MKHALKPQHRRTGWVVTIAGAVAIGAVAMVMVVLARPLPPEHDESLFAAEPSPRVTVTASPTEPQEVGLEPIMPITASAEPKAAVVEVPQVEVSPNLNQHSIDDPASPWVVINKLRPVTPQDWAPPTLQTVNGAELVPEAAVALGEMANAAKAADALLKMGTGYRTFGYQQLLYEAYVDDWGAERADRFSARPGYSEHQTGWVVDVYASEECRLKECFADEPAGQWLADYAHEYGFIVRYPAGAEAVTGYTYEPWHLRYVGVALATHMHKDGIDTLEEVFGLDAAPDY